MRSCRWSEQYSLGVPVIDRDHRQLIEAMGAVEQLAAEGAANAQRRAVEAGMAAVLHYTHSHFDREEMLMRLSGYPDLERHRRLHKALAKRADALDAAFRARPSKLTAQQFCVQVSDWLLAHITSEDAKIKPWVEKLDAAA